MKIVKVNELTPIQSGMLFQYMLTNDKSSYMGTEIFELEGIFWRKIGNGNS